MSSPASSPPIQRPHPPVSILSTPTAQTYAHVHPLLLLSLFGLRFRALVDDPYSTLWSLLPAVAVLQGVYVVLCLPAAKRPGSEATSGSEKKRVGVKRKGADAESVKGSERIIPALHSLTLPFLLGTPLLAIILVLFGAPFTTHIPETLLCAAHMSILAGTSLVYVHGTDGSAWREIWGVSRVIDALWGGAVGVGLGAWFGAVPIPLDWDRPWQAYPITIITGAYIGYAIGATAGRTPLLYGKRIQFLPPEDDVADGEKEISKKGDRVDTDGRSS